jgi:hypothetical protein
MPGRVHSRVGARSRARCGDGEREQSGAVSWHRSCSKVSRPRLEDIRGRGIGVACQDPMKTCSGNLRIHPRARLRRGTAPPGHGAGRDALTVFAAVGLSISSPLPAGDRHVQDGQAATAGGGAGPCGCLSPGRRRSSFLHP